MPKINQEEYEVLKEALSDGYEWIARDSHNPLCTHRHKPVKQDHWIQQYWGNTGNGYKEIDDRLFQFIQWEDEEPYNIAELIEEYEKDYKGSWEHAIEFSGEVFGESVGTEVKKNKKWLKDEVDKIVGEYQSENIFANFTRYMIYDIKDVINQLDEPEVTLDRAFEKVAESYLMTKEEIWRHLERLEAHGGKVTYDEPEVLSQELPVIPKFVAEYLGFAKSDTTLMRVLELANTRNEWEKWEKEYDWIEENHELFARAWLDGFTVEEEPLYRARLKVITDEFIASYLRTQSSDAEDRLKALEIGSKYIHEDYRHLSEFTEDELKRLDIWDSEQWEVEELEE